VLLKSQAMLKMNQQLWRSLQIIAVLFSCLIPFPVKAQVTPDDTLPDNSIVTPQGEKIQIEGGTARGNNLFHSFEEFSVPGGKEAVFNNAESIENILSRVTGGNESVINGGIGANGSANVFLINPAGIIFGENAFLNVGGSFIGSTADSLLFPDGIGYSATDVDAAPMLTINAPIGLGFRDTPQPITNSSLFDIDNSVGLSVPKDKTLALIGGDLSLAGGIISTEGGRIELGSVGKNSTVSLTKIAQGWDVGYEGVENFQDLSLTGQAVVESKGTDTGDIEVQGQNISVLEGSSIDILTSEGKAGNLRIFAADSVEVSDSKADSDRLGSVISNSVEASASGAGSTLAIDTKQLTVNNGGQIAATTFGSNQGGNIDLKATEILIGQPLIFAADDYIPSVIYTQTDLISTGDGGDINLETTRLKIEDGGEINTQVLGSGNGGNLLINAVESVELTGEDATAQPTPSFLISGVGDISSATGNSGDLTINTSTLKITDGAQISASAQNIGNGGVLTINADKSVLLKGFSPQAEFTNSERSGIFVSAQPSFKDESGKIVTTTGNGGTLNLTTDELTVKDGAVISAGTFSRGNGGDANLNVNRLVIQNGSEIRAGSFIGADPLDTERGAGGTLNINAKESVEVTGTGNINGEKINSGLLVKAESNGSAGNINLNSNSLTVSNGGSISAATVAGSGGNIDLRVDDSIRLQDDSLISAAATGRAKGGNINLDTDFIVASPNGNNDILASAGKEGTGGNIRINAESVFGIEVRSQNEQTNDLDATGGVDGEVIINTPDTDITQGILEAPENVVEVERTVAQVCRNDNSSLTSNSLVVNGKGGVAPESSSPLSSENLLAAGRVQNQALIQPLQTASGEIMPARGVIKTPSGKIVLTPYPTENNRRVFQGKANCG
ncbi:MAG: filamentous hemagglutinin N-terminal domain-containing protein, partial [Waterburya sp.]